MNKIDYARIEILAEMAGYELRSYSGRGMYGKQCVAITTENGMLNTLADMAEECDSAEEAALLIRKCDHDSMGLGMVLYWPSIKWEKDEQND